jgi:hypothetical protein
MRLLETNSQLKEKMKVASLQIKHQLELASATIVLMVSRVKILHRMIDKMHVQLIPLDLLMKQSNSLAKQDRKVLIRALHHAPTKTNRNIAKHRVVAARCAMVMML